MLTTLLGEAAIESLRRLSTLAALVARWAIAYVQHCASVVVV